MSEIRIREPREADWLEVLAIADASVRHVAGAGTQEEWLAARVDFDRQRRFQRHVVAERAGALVGYASVESGEGEARRAFRVFVVTHPDDRADVGTELYAAVTAKLADRGASELWFREYADDLPFLGFIESLGFSEARRFPLPSGTLCVELRRELR